MNSKGCARNFAYGKSVPKGSKNDIFFSELAHLRSWTCFLLDDWESISLGILLICGLIRVNSPKFARRNKNASKYLLLFNLAEIKYGLCECKKFVNSFQNSCSVERILHVTEYCRKSANLILKDELSVPKYSSSFWYITVLRSTYR